MDIHEKTMYRVMDLQGTIVEDQGSKTQISYGLKVCLPMC
jgi:hypothetical protein